MSKQAKILIVDDKKENLIALRAVLDSLDITIVEALSGADALNELLNDNEFALVILDVQMPEMDGFEVAELMLQNSRTRDIPIIFVTALSKDQQYIFKGYSAGAVDYVSKPFSPEIMICKVRIFMNLYLQKQQLLQKTVELQNAINKMTVLKNEIKELREFIPICSSCHSIRDEKGQWQNLEVYFKAQSDSQLSHSLCPQCIKELYPDYANKILKKDHSE